MERSTRGTGVVTSFNSDTDSNLADLGRTRCVSLLRLQRELHDRSSLAGRGGHGESLRRTRDDAAGTQSGSYFDERATGNTGTAQCRLPLRWQPVSGVG